MRIAIAGNPNAGKTTLFNQLTGLKQTVGNYPGVTVEVKKGKLNIGDVTHEIIDLPGIYSLYPNSEEEFVTVDVLLKKSSKYHPDLILYVADATNIERNFLLFTQLADLNIPMILCLTKTDEAIKFYEWNSALLSERIKIPLLESDRNIKANLSELILTNSAKVPALESFTFDEPEVSKVIKTYFPEKEAFLGLQLAHRPSASHLSNHQREQFLSDLDAAGFKSYSLQAKEILQRYDWINTLLSTAFRKKPKRGSLTERIDAYLMNPFVGAFTFIFVLFVIFQLVFSLAAYPSDWIDSSISALSGLLIEHLPANWFTSLLVEGVIGGITGIIIFVPQIFLLFAALFLLEESGYMARAVYISDSFMRAFGMNGRSLVSLISGTACAIPAIMAARTISNPKERLITILTTPFISCSARLPIYTLLVALIAPDEKLFGWLDPAGLLLLILYITGAVSAFLVGWFLKMIFKKKKGESLILELPDYKNPAFKPALNNAYTKSKLFLLDAGKIIFIASLIIWLSAHIGPSGTIESEPKAGEPGIEQSFVGIIGKAVQPALEPIGYDWKMSIAIMTSFAAREAFVSTVSILYPNPDPENLNFTTHIEGLTYSDGQVVFNFAVSVSLLLFYIFAMQCVSTLVIIKKETGTWVWPVYLFIGMTAVAYLTAFVGFNLAQ